MTVRSSNSSAESFFIFSNTFILALGPPSLIFNLYRGFVWAVKRPGRDVSHLPPYSTEVKNEWSYTFSLSWRCTGKTLHSQERSCKSRKAAVSFIVSVRLSICPHISTRLLPGPVLPLISILGWGVGWLLRQCVEKIQMR